MSGSGSLARIVWLALVGVGLLTITGVSIGLLVGMHLGHFLILSRASLIILGTVVVIAVGSSVAVVGQVVGAEARRWMSQLEMLRDFTRAVGLGQTSAELPIAAADDWGELAYALREMAQQLEEAATQRETFLATVAHDLRTPLTAVMAQVEAMLTGVVPVDAQRLSTLQTDLARLHAMVEDVLLLAAARVGQRPPLSMRRFDLAPLVRRVCDRFRPLAEAAAMTIAVDAPLEATVEGDAHRLDTVLSTLVHNAIRHGDAHTTVAVEMAVDEAGLSVQLRNRGPDLPLSVLHHLGEPFVRGDAARTRGGGTGLGLAIAAFWAEQHGGTLELQSGGGTFVATVRLPSTSSIGRDVGSHG